MMIDLFSVTNSLFMRLVGVRLFLIVLCLIFSSASDDEIVGHDQRLPLPRSAAIANEGLHVHFGPAVVIEVMNVAPLHAERESRLSRWTRKYLRPNMKIIYAVLYSIGLVLVVYTQVIFWHLCQMDRTSYFNVIDAALGCLVACFFAMFNEDGPSTCYYLLVRLHHLGAVYVVCVLGGSVAEYFLSGEFLVHRETPQLVLSPSSTNVTRYEIDYRTGLYLTGSVCSWGLWRKMDVFYKGLPYLLSFMVYNLAHELVSKPFIVVVFQWVLAAMALSCVLLIFLNRSFE